MIIEQYLKNLQEDLLEESKFSHLAKAGKVTAKSLERFKTISSRPTLNSAPRKFYTQKLGKASMDRRVAVQVKSSINRDRIEKIRLHIKMNGKLSPEHQKIFDALLKRQKQLDNMEANLSHSVKG